LSIGFSVVDWYAFAFVISEALVFAVAPLRFDWFRKFEAVLGVATG